MRDREAEHLSARQRTFIRYSARTYDALAAMYGVRPHTIMLIRQTAFRGHPARLAAIRRRWSSH